MSQVFAIARLELLIAYRNLWVACAVLMMAAFSAALTLAATGAGGAAPSAAAASSLTTLSVYLVPLLSLLLSFDAIAGEAERGTLALTLSHPVSRAGFLAGKFAAHLTILLVAVSAGVTLAAGLTSWRYGIKALEAWPFIRLFLSAAALAAAFLGAGYLISTLFRHTSAAAGAAVALWLLAVVLYDVALLGALLADDGGVFTRKVFPWVLSANPADAFRLLNAPAPETPALQSGLSAAADATGHAPLIALLLWPVATLVLANRRFRRMEP